MKRNGRLIIDSRNNLRIVIKPCDIKGAVCRNHQKCVIAKALLRRKGVEWVDVGASSILVAKNSHVAKRYRLDGIAKEQVRYFDTHDGAFAPGVLTLSVYPLTHKYRKSRKLIIPRGPRGSYKKHRQKPTR